MNKYTLDYIPNFSSKDLNTASIKPRLDTMEIAEKAGFKNIIKNYNSKPKLGKVIAFFQFLFALIKLPKKSTLFIQYPFQLQGFDGVLKYFVKRKKLNGILLIHDTLILRNPTFKNIIKQESSFFNYFKHIIVHNDKMNKELSKYIQSNINIYELGIFDYLVSSSSSPIKNKKINSPIKIAITGNLSRLKFLDQLHKIQNVDFYLYGPGYDEDLKANNVHYCGSVHPDELNKLLADYDFGLIWDGNSIEKLVGNNNADYMKFNNPYKLSATISAGIPVISSTEAGINKIIELENIGITVDSLMQLEGMEIDETSYLQKLSNCQHICSKINRGNYLSTILLNIVN